LFKVAGGFREVYGALRNNEAVADTLSIYEMMFKSRKGGIGILTIITRPAINWPVEYADADMIVPTIWTAAPAMTQIRRPNLSLHGEAAMQHPNHEASRNEATIMAVVVASGAFPVR
jgi:hypothetical protein